MICLISSVILMSPMTLTSLAFKRWHNCSHHQKTATFSWFLRASMRVKCPSKRTGTISITAVRSFRQNYSRLWNSLLLPTMARSWTYLLRTICFQSHLTFWQKTRSWVKFHSCWSAGTTPNFGTKKTMNSSDPKVLLTSNSTQMTTWQQGLQRDVFSLSCGMNVSKSSAVSSPTWRTWPTSLSRTLL